MFEAALSCNLRVMIGEIIDMGMITIVHNILYYILVSSIRLAVLKQKFYKHYSKRNQHVNETFFLCSILKDKSFLKQMTMTLI